MPRRNGVLLVVLRCTWLSTLEILAKAGRRETPGHGISVVLVRTLAEAVARRARTWLLFSRCQLRPQLLEDPLARIECHLRPPAGAGAGAHGRRSAGPAHGEQASFSAWRAGHLAAQCRTLRDCIQMLLAYFRVLTDTLPPTLEEQGDRAIVRYEFVRSSECSIVCARSLRWPASWCLGACSRPGCLAQRNLVRARSAATRTSTSACSRARRCSNRAARPWCFRAIARGQTVHWDPQLFQVLRAQATMRLPGEPAQRGHRIHDLVAYSDATYARDARRARHLA